MISRYVEARSAVIDDGAAVSAAVDFRRVAGGVVIIPTSWTAANLGFYVCDTLGGTYVILRDESGNPVQVSGILTTGARAYSLPSQLFGAAYIKLWSKSSTAATETDTNQSGAITLTLMLKS
jgi:hypothetical protein